MWNEDGQQEREGNPARGPPGQSARVVPETWPHCCSQEENIGVLLPLVANRNVVDRHHQCVPLKRTELHVLQTRSCDDCTLDVGMTWVITVQALQHAWSPPLPGDVKGPCATNRPNWTRKTPAVASPKRRKPNPPKTKGNVATGHVVSGMVVWINCSKYILTELRNEHPGGLWLQHAEKIVWPGNTHKTRTTARL